MADIKMGDLVLCVNAKGMEEHGLQYGGKYSANTVMNIPGQGEYVGVIVPERGQILVVEASRFEKAHTLKYRVWTLGGEYVLIDEDFDAEDHLDKKGSYTDVSLTLSESNLGDIEEAIAQVLKVVRDTENETNATTH